MIRPRIHWHNAQSQQHDLSQCNVFTGCNVAVSKNAMILLGDYNDSSGAIQW